MFSYDSRGSSETSDSNTQISDLAKRDSSKNSCTYLPPDNLDTTSELSFCDLYEREMPSHPCQEVPSDILSIPLSKALVIITKMKAHLHVVQIQLPRICTVLVQKMIIKIR